LQNPREIAFRALHRRERGEGYIENLLDEELNRTSLAAADRGLATELTYGVVRRLKTLDWLIAGKTPNAVPRLELRVLLRLGLYQLFWLGRIPDHAAVHETVELGKFLGFRSQSGFLNAVLRGYVREKAQTEQQLEGLKASEPALGYSHPEWLVERWQHRWGPEKTRELLEWNNIPPYTFARINLLRTNATDIARIWQGEGVKFTAKTWDWIDEGAVFQLDSHPPLSTLPSFQQGLFYVQDPSTFLAVVELGAQPGETILDVCAAPGGKTTLIGQWMKNQGKIIAQDTHRDRLALVRQNYIRLGLTCVETILAPYDSLPKPERRFDRILVDAPCSNTGVLRRRIDLRWRIKAEEITRLGQTQMMILRQAAERLKPGGILIYSTCSLEPEENETVLKQFLAECADFELEKQRELVPFRDSVDGAYVARLRLKK
jgi:16S rRNA (cytosine967-C5)-methyltransferase